MALPYENASAGTRALDEAEKMLRKFGCSNFGVMNNWDLGIVMVQFQWKERRVSIEASWRGYAEAWLKEHPWSHRMRKTRDAHEMEAKRRGELAAPSILRDWIKGQVTAVEMGLMPFEHAFLPHMLMHDGQRLIDRAVLLLEAPSR
jgi:hypothetical protein